MCHCVFRFNPGGTYVAELGLLNALEQPRDYHRGEHTTQLKQVKLPTDEFGDPLDAEYGERITADVSCDSFVSFLAHPSFSLALPLPVTGAFESCAPTGRRRRTV